MCVSREEIERRSLVSDWLCTIFTTSVVSARREWWHITRNRQPLRPLVGMAGSRCYFAMERASAERAGACVSVNDEKQHGRPGRISLSLPDTPWWLLYFLIARLVPFGIHFCCWKQKKNVCLFLRTIYWSILSGGHLGRLSWIDHPNIKNAANIFQLFFFNLLSLGVCWFCHVCRRDATDTTPGGWRFFPVCVGGGPIVISFLEPIAPPPPSIFVLDVERGMEVIGRMLSLCSSPRAGMCFSALHFVLVFWTCLFTLLRTSVCRSPQEK